MEMEYPSRKSSSQQTDMMVERVQPDLKTSTASDTNQNMTFKGSKMNNMMQQRSSNLLMMQRQLGNQAVKQLMTQTTNISPSSLKLQQTQVPSEANPNVNSNDQILQAKFIYTNTARLSRIDGKKNTSKAESYKVSSIKLPTSFRPPTQFGQSQMAHSISWTLLKKAYESVSNMNAAKFVESYLQADWASLEKQKEISKAQSNQSVEKKYAYNQLEQFFEEYNPTYFQKLLDDELTSLEWATKIQKAVSDYFVALQLAPLTTHTGFTQKKGTIGINESKPSGHGEPAANLILMRLEEKLRINLDEDEDDKEFVESAAKMYWDPGSDNIHGIHKPDELNMLQEEYERAFQRVYPLIWGLYKENVQKAFGNKSKPVDSSGSVSKLVKKAENIDEVQLEELKALEKPKKVNKDSKEENTSSLKSFQALVKLEENMQDEESLAMADSFKIDKLLLSNDRPPTKYGPMGQKSHTVSWSVTLRSLAQVGSNRSLYEMLEDMYIKWVHLEHQDWKGMLSSNLLQKDKIRKGMKPGTFDQHVQRNKDRLQENYLLIQHNMGKIKEVFDGKKLGELGWQNFIQDMISDYVVVYQSAPLTTANMGKADGKGEADANLYLGLLEENLIDQARSLPLLDKDSPARKHMNYDLLFDKFGSEFTKDKLQKLPESESEAITDLQEVTVPTQEQWENMMMLLGKHEATKHLDVKWSLFQGKLYTAELQRQYMSFILHEWEQKIKEAYPAVGKFLDPILAAHSNNILISDGMKEAEKGDKKYLTHGKSAATLLENMNTTREKYKEKKEKLSESLLGKRKLAASKDKNEEDEEKKKFIKTIDKSTKKEDLL